MRGAETRVSCAICKSATEWLYPAEFKAASTKKKQPDETFTAMTAYEVSISKLAAFDDESEFDIEEEFDLYSTPRTFENEQ